MILSSPAAFFLRHRLTSSLTLLPRQGLLWESYRFPIPYGPDPIMSANRKRKACKQCRQLKVKCERKDGSEQCKRCQKWENGTCEVEDTPTTPPPASSSTQSRLTALEKQMKRLKGQYDLILTMLAPGQTAIDGLSPTRTSSRAPSQESTNGDIPGSPKQ